MTGRDDAAASEAAELQALRRRADERRQELGDTLAAFTGKLAEDMDLRRLARRGARRAAAGLTRATAAAARRALPGNGSAAAARRALPGNGGAAPAAGALRHAPGSRRGRVAFMAGAAGLAAAGTAWWLFTRRRRRTRCWLPRLGA